MKVTIEFTIPNLTILNKLIKAIQALEKFGLIWRQVN